MTAPPPERATPTAPGAAPAADTLRATLVDLVERAEPSAAAAAATSDDAPLALPSLAVVVLAESIEDTLGVRLRAADVTRHNFATLGALRALVATRLTEATAAAAAARDADRSNSGPR